MKLISTATFLNLAELLALLLAAPFLLFPALWSPGVTVSLTLLLALAAMRWVVRRELWPATPFNAALFLFMLMLPVAVWASAIPDLTWPKLLGILLGLFFFRLAGLGIRDQRTLTWGLGVFIAAGGAILVTGALNTGWSNKVPLLQPLLQQLPKLHIALPGSAGQAINANQLAGAALLLALTRA